MSFDLENLREMEKKAEELKAEVKELEQRKSELSNAEQRALEKEKYQLLLEEKRQLKQRKKEEKKARKERRKERLRYEEPERSFFAKDHEGRNGIHKLGGFTFYAMIVTGIFSPISIFVMSLITTVPSEVAELQTVRLYALVALIIPFGIIGWRNCRMIKLNTQFGFGIIGSICLLYAVLSQLKRVNSGDQLDDLLSPNSAEAPADKKPNDALTPDSWEKKEDKPSQD